MIKILSYSLGVFAIVCVPCKAQVLEESQTLNLGTIAVVDNSTIGTVTISKEGLISKSGGVAILVFGRPAIFELRNYDSNRRLYITVQATQSGTVTDEFSPEQFTVQSYDSADYLTTDAQGFAEFSVGATFATSGSGTTNFRDTIFSAAYTVTVNY